MVRTIVCVFQQSSVDVIAGVDGRNTLGYGLAQMTIGVAALIKDQLRFQKHVVGMREYALCLVEQGAWPHREWRKSVFLTERSDVMALAAVAQNAQFLPDALTVLAAIAESAQAEQALRRYRSASSRRQTLARLFSDRAAYDKIVESGRYLRLCAALARASEQEERMRQIYLALARA